MNDRPEFLDRLKADLAAGVPGFRGTQRRRRVAASAVAGVALLSGLGAFVAFGDDGEPTDSVSAVGEAEPPESSEPAEEVEPLTGTVRDLTDTVGDLEDEGLQLGYPPDLVAIGQTPGGEAEACPLTATSQSGEADFAEGDFQEVGEGDDLIAFIGQHISDTYPEGAPIRSSSLYVVTDPDDRRATVAVLARWSSDSDTLIGAWFGVVKTAEFGLAISSDWGCTPFLWETSTTDGGFAPTAVGGYSQLSCGLVDYDPWTDPQQLADASDLVVVGTVRAIREGRSYLYEEIDEVAFGGVTLELTDTTDLSGAPIPGPIYVEVEACWPDGRLKPSGILVGPLSAQVVATIIPPDSPAVWFLVETRDWTLEEVPEQLNPLAGRPSADTPLYAPHIAGVWYEDEAGRVGVSNTGSPAGLLPSFSAFVDLPADQLVGRMNEAIDTSSG